MHAADAGHAVDGPFERGLDPVLVGPLRHALVEAPALVGRAEAAVLLDDLARFVLHRSTPAMFAATRASDRASRSKFV